MSVEVIVQKATAGIVRYLGARGILQLPAGPVGEAIKFDIDDFIESAVRAAVKERGGDTELRRVAKEVLDRLRESKMIAATAQHFECAVELKQLADRLDAAMQQQPRGKS